MGKGENGEQLPAFHPVYTSNSLAQELEVSLVVLLVIDELNLIVFN